MDPSVNPSEINSGSNRVLVCGLGSIGQHCVGTLKAFGVSVSAIDLSRPSLWEVPDLPGILDQFVIADCRQTSVLEQIGIHRCRAVLLVTGNERMNLESAFAVRSLNPRARLVVRSSKQNLNSLLSQQLGNFAAYEATEVTAPAFAVAALGGDVIGWFKVGNQPFRAIKHTVAEGDVWCNRKAVEELNTSFRRVLAHLTPKGSPLAPDLAAWDPDQPIRPGDIVFALEASDWRVLSTEPGPSPSQPESKPGRSPRRVWQWLRNQVSQFWKAGGPRRVVVVGGVFAVLMLWIGTMLFRYALPDHDLWDSFDTTAILLLGGFGDVFGGLEPEPSIPWWLRLFSLLLTFIGIAFCGLLYGLITERLLSIQFQFLQRRPPVPKQDHIVIVGLGGLGRRVAGILHQVHLPLVGITNQGPDPNISSHIPVVQGKIADTLAKVNLATARSVVTVTRDELDNLEIALLARQINPRARLVIRTLDPGMDAHIAKLFPATQVLCTNALAAEVFAGAAFGEHMLGLFRMDEQTVLVAEYAVETGDTLCGRLLAEVAYGYGVTPLLYRPRDHATPMVFPVNELRLAAGDQLVVLATINSLQRIERNDVRPPDCRVLVEKALNADAAFAGGNLIAQIVGCELSEARQVMEQLPASIPRLLYRHQARHLIRQLGRARVYSRHVVPA
ncbi:MAG: NAD-binding protein [Candidatus Competibacter sp.]|nr:NAD-binding protein [Candidatus Competibacter sp.]